MTDTTFVSRDGWTASGIGDIQLYAKAKLDRDKEQRALLSFTDTLFEGFCRKAAEYQRYWVDDTLLYYSERTQICAVAPVVDAISESYGLESPVQRTEQNKTSRGSLDLWAIYRGVGILSEWKHGFVQYNAAQLGKAEQDKWHAAWAQAESVSEFDESIGTRGTWRAAFMIVTARSARQRFQPKEDRFPDIDTQITSFLNHCQCPDMNADYVGICIPDRKLQSKHFARYSNYTSGEYFPFFALLGRFGPLNRITRKDRE